MKLSRDIFNQLNFNFNYIVKNRLSLFLIFFFPILSIFIPLFFVPFWISSPVFIQFSIIPVSAIIYANITYSIRNSTIYKNYFLSIQRKDVIYFASLITVLFFALLTSIIQIILLFIFQNLILSEWSFNNSDGSLTIKNIRFLGWFWGIFWITLITFSISFSVRNWIKTEKNYYTLILIVLILSIIFGGTLNDYFSGSSGFNQIINDNNYPNFKVNLFPEDIYWISVLFPYYAPGQIISTSSEFSYDGFVFYDFDVLYLYPGLIRWNILIFMPIIWVSFLAFLGFVL